MRGLCRWWQLRRLIVVTPLIYFGVRAVFLAGPVEGPLQEVQKK